MTPVSMQSVIDKVGSLPTLPIVVIMLNERLSNERTSSEDIAHVIESDQALASQVLRLANSSFFGLRNRVSDIRQAISLMGFATIRNLALASSALSKLRGGKDAKAFSPVRFWEHSIATATASRALADRVDVRLSSEAFTAGLLHDIGKIVLHIWFADDFDRALEYHRERYVTLADAERTVLGFTHADVGYQLSRRWRFPLVLTEAILNHHEPSTRLDYAALVMIVHVADILVETVGLGHGGDEYLAPIAPDAWTTLDLTPEKIDAALGETIESAQSTFDFMSLVN